MARAELQFTFSECQIKVTHSAKVTWFAEKDFIDCNSIKDVISIGIITQTGGSASFSSNMLTTFPFREL